MSREDLDGKTESLIRFYLEQISYSMNERFDEARRQLNSNLSELEFQILERLNEQKKDVESVKQRVQKLEDNSAWSLLIEEANKLGIPPEQLLKKAITEYARKRKRD